MKKLAIIGEFDPSAETHSATNSAIEHSKNALNIEMDVNWVSSADISAALLKEFHGFWVAPGFPFKDTNRLMMAFTYARENNIPLLGTCAGFQHMMIEYAQNVLGCKNARHAEYHPTGDTLFISQLACSLAGREMVLTLKPGSLVSSLYGASRVTEKYYCGFGVNPNYMDLIRNGPARIVGSDSEGEIRVMEYPGHRFHVGTLFVPQASSTEDNPHPLVSGFLKTIDNT